jgi:hypothetical protein
MKNIKYTLLIVVLVIFQIFGICQSSNSQDIRDKDKSSIIIILKNQEKSWNEGNLTDYMQAYHKSDSLRFISKKGITYGWDNTLSMYQKAYPDKASMGNLKFDIIRIEGICEDKVLLTGKWTLQSDGQNKEIGGYFTLIWQNINGNWFIIVDHTS